MATSRGGKTLETLEVVARQLCETPAMKKMLADLPRPWSGRWETWIGYDADDYTVGLTLHAIQGLGESAEYKHAQEIVPVASRPVWAPKDIVRDMQRSIVEAAERLVNEMFPSQYRIMAHRCRSAEVYLTEGGLRQAREILSDLLVEIEATLDPRHRPKSSSSSNV
jgi:hypothetical protein